ncbi:MAG TPA: protein-methionine-sulfoxide reductase heme-binding subunit MsrQ [Chloroflexota bacterium]|nr:protein-methionine-sulfoxide reductase heme-binding subunit MsrQ [Chloroflexota bacterium]
MRWLRRHWLRLLAHIGALIPLGQLLWDAYGNDLTANPIQEITFRTGKTALVLLILSLACTPANTLLGLRQAIPLRRPLGLYAFFYAFLHLLIFAVLDYGLDVSLIWQTVLEKRYVVAGFSAFVLLLPLAVTSTAGWQRRLGKRWRKLHRLVYAAAALAILHFVWLVKADRSEPLTYGAILALLLALRLPAIRRTATRLRYRYTR